MFEQKEKLAFYAKWFWNLFLLVVLSNLLGLVFNDLFIGDSIILNVLGSVVSLLGQFGYAVLLTIMARFATNYAKAGKFYLYGALVVFVCELAGLFVSLAELATVVSLAGSVLSLYGQYHELMTHKGLLSEVDEKLSIRWGSLWTWTLRCLILMMISIPVMILAVAVGGMLSLVGSLGMLVISIVKIVTLYQSAKCFKKMAVQLDSSSSL